MTPLLTADATDETIAVLPEATRASTPHGTPRIPLTIPSAQEYYWRFDWQNDERVVLAEIEAGESVRFDGDDPGDVARWLNEPDE